MGFFAIALNCSILFLPSSIEISNHRTCLQKALRKKRNSSTDKFRKFLQKPTKAADTAPNPVPFCSIKHSSSDLKKRQNNELFSIHL